LTNSFWLGTARSITPAQWLAVACLLHPVALGVAWWHVSSRLLLNGGPGGRAAALGRLAGLLVGSGVLLQLVLVSRLPWIEPSVGCDRLYRLHRRLGFLIGSLLLAHPALLTVGYAAGRDIVLLYSVKTANDLVFASELRALTAHCHFILSRCTDTTEPGQTDAGHERGLIDLRMIARLVPDVRDREVFICGPQPMMKAVAAALGALQVLESSIHYEQFA
jgi:predicted ferric reductase